MNFLEGVRLHLIGQKHLLHAFHLDQYIVRVCHLFSYARRFPSTRKVHGNFATCHKLNSFFSALGAHGPHPTYKYEPAPRRFPPFVTSVSLVPPRHHRVDPRRPPPRNPASHQRTQNEQQRRPEECRRIRRTHSEKLRLHPPSQRQRAK